ncbi:MAG: ABC transporter transmembrane domain-containing protein, partial [Bacilli bacterium]
MKEFIKNLKFTWKYVKKLKGKLIKYCLLNIMAVIISIIVPLLSARLIVELTSNNFHQLLLIGMVMFLVEITRNIIDYFTRYYSQIIYREGLINIKTALGSEIVKIESKCIDSNSSGLFVQRLSEDTSNIADIFNVLNVYLSQIITYCGIFIAILIINKVIFLYCVFMIFVLFLINKLRVKKINVKDKIFRKKKEDVSGFTSELVRGLRDIKMLNAEKNFVDEMHKKVKDLNMARYDMSKTERDYSFVQGSVTDFFNLGSIVLAVGLLLRGILSIPNALIIYNYMSNI